MEGAKAYVLPGVAALLLGAYFVLRPGVDEEIVTPNAAPGETLQAKIDAAVRSAAPTPGLDEPYLTQVRAAVGRAIATCNAASTSPAQLTVRGSVNAAADLGGHFTTVTIQAQPPVASEGIVLCVRQALGDTALDAPSRTQTGSFVEKHP